MTHTLWGSIAGRPGALVAGACLVVWLEGAYTYVYTYPCNQHCTASTARGRTRRRQLALELGPNYRVFTYSPRCASSGAYVRG